MKAAIVVSIVFFGFIVGANTNSDVCLFRATTMDGELQYLVPAERLLDTRNSWDPNSQPFPTDLVKHSAIARNQVMERIGAKHPILLHRVTLHLFHERVRGALIERWFIIFSFIKLQYEHDEAFKELDVVMLLNGTVAKEAGAQRK